MQAFGPDSVLRMQVSIIKKEVNGENSWFTSFPGHKDNSSRITGFRVYWSGDGDTGDLMIHLCY